MSDSAPAIMSIERLGELIEGYWTTQVVRAAAQLKLPDLLEAQSLLPEELAHRAGAHAGSVGRLLRGDDNGRLSLRSPRGPGVAAV
jgi:hypothetical protein